MSTIIELFDNENPIHNVVSTLANRPDKLICLGNQSKFSRNLPYIRQFLASAGLPEVEIEFRSAHGRSLSGITEVLEACVRENADCAIDLTGGGELYAAAAGIVFERFRSQGLQLHQYNIRTGRVYDCDEDGRTPVAPFPGISVEQQIALHGGLLESAELCTEALGAEELMPLEENVLKLWDLVGAASEAWNEFVFGMNQCRAANRSADPMELRFPAGTISKPLDNVLRRLSRSGIFDQYSSNQEQLSCRYANAYVRNLMNKGGNLLEEMVFLAAVRARDKEGKAIYQSAASGAVIDWDGRINTGQAETTNEVDGIFMHGAMPVFVSCKSGCVDSEELYKLSEVTHRFGGKYARAALFCSDARRILPGFLRRAEDMGIRVFHGVKDWDMRRFLDAMAGLVG